MTTHNVVLKLASAAGPGPFTHTSHSHSLLYPDTSASSYCADTEVVPEVSDRHHDSRPLQPPTTYASCFGLPYQDHNYGAPPPPTPPASPQPLPPKVNGHIDIDNVSCHTTVVTSSTPPGGAVVSVLPAGGVSESYTGDDSVTRCICQFQHDDGYMICCDQCGVWQHVDCMGVDRQNIPDSYLCEKCQPRPVDRQRAKQLQIRKRELFNIDTSATETEDETPHGRSRKTKNKKKKEKRKERDSKDSRPQPQGKKLKKSTGMPSIKNMGQKDKKPLLKPLSPLGKKAKTLVKKSPVKTKNLKSMGSSLSLKVNGQGGRVPWEHEPEDSFEEAEHNNYSLDVQDMLTTRKLNGVSEEGELKLSTSQLLIQRCSVAQVTVHHKGLEALDDLPKSSPVIEYRGKVMLREQYDKENIFPSSRKQPHVLFYRNFDHQDLCIDATTFGNDARFVRRSCTPNAEVRHLLDKNNVHFVIFSTESIRNGAEVTVPFDFNYEDCGYAVECACGGLTCPVTKSKKTDPPLPKVAKKRRRSGKSSEETTTATTAPDSAASSSSSGPVKPTAVTSPAKPTSPAAAPAPAKRKRAQSLKVQMPTTPIDEKKTSTSSSGPFSPSVKEETRSSFSPSHGLASPPPGTCAASSDGEEHEKLRRPSREDRKMDAILKAIERMERREERRREALARLGQKDKDKDKDKVEKDVKTEADSCADSKTSTAVTTAVQETSVTVAETVTPTTAAAAAAVIKTEDVEVSKEEIKEEVLPESTATPAQIKKTNKKKKGVKRRSTRSSSSVSTRESESVLSADENSNASVTTTPGLPVSAPASEQNSATTTPSAGLADRAFRFPKTKKHMMNEWLSGEKDIQRPLSIRTECPEGSTEEEEADFVKCQPSPHADTLLHLRRNSMSSSMASHSKAINSSGDSTKGFAKKRWLRQAMFESSGPTESKSPVPSSGGGGGSPNPSCANSPGASPPLGTVTDFVTPLKKRRLARESISQEYPYPPTPSTPLPYSSGLPSEPLDASPVASDGERPPSDCEKSVSEGEKSRPEVDHSRQWRNGLRPTLAPMTPITPNDNLFERLRLASSTSSQSEGATSFSVFKQESMDSTISESLLTPRKNSLEFVQQVDSNRDSSDSGTDEAECQALSSSSSRLQTITEEGGAAAQPSCSNSRPGDSAVDTDNSPQKVDSGCPGHKDCSEDSPAGKPSNSVPWLHCEAKDSDLSKVTSDSAERQCYADDSDSVCVSDVDNCSAAPAVVASASVCDSTQQRAPQQQQQVEVAPSGESDSSSREGARHVVSDSSVRLHHLTSDPASDTEPACSSSTEHATVAPSGGVSSADDMSNITAGGVVVATCSSAGATSLARLTCASAEPDRSEGKLESSYEVDTSQVLSKLECEEQPSSSRKSAAIVEEGELDSSFAPSVSDTEVVSERSEGKDCGEQAVSCSSELQAAPEKEVQEEKEEGEITSEDEEEGTVSCSANSISQIDSERRRTLNSPPRAESSSGRRHPSDLSPSASPRAGMMSSWREREDHGHKYKGSSSSSSGYNCADSGSGRAHYGSPGTAATSSCSSSARYEHRLDSYIHSTSEERERERDGDLYDSVSSTAPSDTCGEHSKHVSSSAEVDSVSPDGEVSPNTAGGVSSSGIPVSRKKVSLLEYRKRMKTKPSESPSSSRAYRRASSTSSGSTTPTSWDSRDGYRLRSTPPLPPVSNSVESAANTTDFRPSKGTACSHPEKRDPEVRWNASATEAERIREQTQLSLSERLRREFGLDPSESEEEDDKQDDEPPPPPPPPPPQAVVTQMYAPQHMPVQMAPLAGAPMQLPHPGPHQQAPAGRPGPGQAMPSGMASGLPMTTTNPPAPHPHPAQNMLGVPPPPQMMASGPVPIQAQVPVSQAMQGQYQHLQAPPPGAMPPGPMPMVSQAQQGLPPPPPGQHLPPGQVPMMPSGAVSQPQPLPGPVPPPSTMQMQGLAPPPAPMGQMSAMPPPTGPPPPAVPTHLLPPPPSSAPPHPQQQSQPQSEDGIPSLMSLSTFPTSHFRQHLGTPRGGRPGQPQQQQQQPAVTGSLQGPSCSTDTQQQQQQHPQQQQADYSQNNGPAAIAQPSSSQQQHPQTSYQKINMPKKFVFGEHPVSASASSSTAPTSSPAPVLKINYNHGYEAPTSSTYQTQ